MFRPLAPIFAGILSVFATLAMPCPAVAQQTESAPAAASRAGTAASVTIAEVNRALTDPSATTPRTLTFRGTVAFVSHVGDLCLLDGPNGVMVEPRGDSPRPAMGDEVEVTASVKFQTADATDPALLLKAQAIRRTGPGQLPDPVKAKLGEALNGRHHMRWVEVEGVVMQSFMDHGVLSLHMTDAYGWGVVTVHHWRGGDEMLAKGWGARLRLRCPNVGRGHRALRVSSSEQITLIQPGTAALFDAPQADAAELVNGESSFDRIRLSGTVLAVHEGIVNIRSGDTAFRCSILAPYVSSSNPPLALELIPPPVPEMKPGDRVEAVGSPLKRKPWLEMYFASFRVQQSPGELPPPRDAAGTALFTTSVSDRVQVQGEVRSRTETPGRNGMRETLTLDAGGVTLEARMESAGGGRLSEFREGDVLKLTGVLLPPSGATTAQLLLTEIPGKGQASVAVIQRGLPPAAIQTITILAGGLAVALAAAWWLQRQVRLRTAALADANASLKVEAEALHQTRAELARALDQERELGELKSRFVSMVSHEFRTPLGITMSAVELLQHYQDRLPPEQKEELLGDIQRSTKTWPASWNRSSCSVAWKRANSASVPRPWTSISWRGN